MPLPSSSSISPIPVEFPILDNYEIVDILGEGGSGVTYRAKQRATVGNAEPPAEREVAIKALSLSAIEDWKVLELFEREAQILRQLDRDGIPKYIDYFHTDVEDDRHFYIVQELAPGKTLQEWVTSGWRASEDEIKDIAAQILKILIYLHRQHPPIVHRDLKPTNILRTETGKIYLVDFGAVRQTYHDTFMRGSTVVGTFGYMAPEQFRSQAVPATDLYGLGATILYLLTQRSPAEIPQEGLRLNFRDRLQVSPDFTDWLEKMLEPDLSRRFSSAAASLSTLNKKQANKRGSGAGSEFKIALTVLAIFLVSLGLIFERYKFFFLSRLGVTSKEPFVELARNPEPRKIQEYLDRGFDVNARNESNETLMNVALRTNITQLNEIVELLIDRGADVSDDSNLTEQIRTAKKTLSDMIYACNRAKMLAAHNSYDCNSELPRVASHLESEKGFIINELIVYAAANNQPVLLKKLLDKGANINKKHRTYNVSLLYVAAMYPDGELMKLLLERGLTPNETDGSVCTPLHHAIYKYSQNKSDWYTYDAFFNNGMRLNVGTQINDMAIVHLIQKGADIDKKCVIDRREWYSSKVRELSPLELAAAIGEPSLVTLIQTASAQK